MEQEEEVNYDKAVFILVKDDDIHVRSSDNLDADELMELLVSATLALKNILEETSVNSGQVH